MAGVFEVQDEIAAAIAQALQMRLGPQAATPRYKPDLPAYEAFLKGRHLILQASSGGLAQGQAYLEQAISLDPHYADAYAELSHLFIVLAAYGIQPVRKVMPIARAMATRARDLDPSASRVHAELALVAAILDFDWKSAEAHLQLAKDAGGFAPEWRFRCAYWILVPQGRFPEAIRETGISLEQDPLSPISRSVLALILQLAGHCERAITEARKALELDPAMWLAWLAMAWAYADRGMSAEARAPAEKVVRLAPSNITSTGMVAGILFRLGEQKAATELIAQCGQQPMAMWIYHLLRSDFEAALDSYEAALAQRDPSCLVFAASCMLKPLRESPRWPAIARKMNLPVTV